MENTMKEDIYLDKISQLLRKALTDDGHLPVHCMTYMSL